MRWTTTTETVCLTKLFQPFICYYFVSLSVHLRRARSLDHLLYNKKHSHTCIEIPFASIIFIHTNYLTFDDLWLWVCVAEFVLRCVSPFVTGMINSAFSQFSFDGSFVRVRYMG